ncbi:hypothetical protein HETIRDRAFT_324735 [Heterobasidion irregulare TC 32-1]|uniref:Uncharacterized protein n=1 Tax=Heterobasidion irregulare (strain TC 32-1) TaxID=747525 RepID=W4JZG7_HETIT|nr:uncharacterized protein HETIRDRAFT_324735 [Heterobasidion irregulare TC 32-1]ETW78973.1 hypothetical protein HETIRDRAFT_324735 [Heterobasidion irregulare TC 32-1]
MPRGASPLTSIPFTGVSTYDHTKTGDDRLIVLRCGFTTFLARSFGDECWKSPLRHTPRTRAVSNVQDRLCIAPVESCSDLPRLPMPNSPRSRPATC